MVFMSLSPGQFGFGQILSLKDRSRYEERNAPGETDLRAPHPHLLLEASWIFLLSLGEPSRTAGVELRNMQEFPEDSAPLESYVLFF